MNIWANLYRHHRWSNLTLIDFLSELEDEQIRYAGPGVYGDVLSTIRHVISSDADYVRIIPDAPDVPQIDDGESFDLATSFLLAQIIHHATEHRSQIRSVLSAHGVDPPEISVWAWRMSDEGQAILDALRPVG